MILLWFFWMIFPATSLHFFEIYNNGALFSLTRSYNFVSEREFFTSFAPTSWTLNYGFLGTGNDLIKYSYAFLALIQNWSIEFPDFKISVLKQNFTRVCKLRLNRKETKNCFVPLMEAEWVFCLFILITAA